MESKNTNFLCYHPESFNDSNNERKIPRHEMVLLLEKNRSIGKCVSEQIYDQESIRPYFDCDIHGHSSDPSAMNITLQQIQDTICNLFAHITDRKIVIAVSSVYKQTQKGNKLSVHCM